MSTDGLWEQHLGLPLSSQENENMYCGHFSVVILKPFLSLWSKFNLIFPQLPSFRLCLAFLVPL